MRNILLAIALVALLPPSVATAEQLHGQKSDQRSDKSRLPDKSSASKQLPVKRVGQSNSCAAYGAGFVKIEGTETCMKVGGVISIGAGVSSGGR